MTAAPLVVDLWADIVCPWCYVGSWRLARALPEAQVRLHPFLLRPDTPPEGISIPDMLRQRYGVEPEAAWARVEAEARASELPLDLRRQQRMVPTAAAHALLTMREGAPQVALARALYAAYFDDARDISQVDVLVDIGDAHGLDAAAVRAQVTDPDVRAQIVAEAQLASSRGIRGVPFFIVRVGDGPGLALSGAQPEAALRQAANQARGN